MSFVYLAGTAIAVAQPPKTQVMVVGVAHFVARRDVHNSVFEDSPLSPKRQLQIEQIVGRLARFHPTKVLVEASMGDRGVIEQYHRYLAGQFVLPAGEVYQIGFRLAKASGDSSIYPIDTWGPTLVADGSSAGNRIDRFLRSHFNTIDVPVTARFEAHYDGLERDGTYLQLLQYLNTDAAIRANAAWYSVFAGAGRDADDAGAEYVAQWYVRNTYIWSNISSIIQPGDRAIVMMGQGHEYLLREFARLDPDAIDIDPLTYLR